MVATTQMVVVLRPDRMMQQTIVMARNHMVIGAYVQSTIVTPQSYAIVCERSRYACRFWSYDDLICYFTAIKHKTLFIVALDSSLRFCYFACYEREFH